MLIHVIKKEILARLSSPMMIITFVLCSALILLSFYTGVQNYGDQVAEVQSAQSMQQETLRKYTSYDQIKGGIQVSRPPQVLGVFAQGLENVIGRHALVRWRSNPELTRSTFAGDPIRGLVGDLDVLFIVKTVLSLLTILFIYNTVSGEKEEGTLRLMLSYPIPRNTLLLGKAIGGLLCLVIPLYIPMVLGIALLALYPGVNISGEAWMRLALLLGGFGLYVALFFALGLFVSTLTKKSSVSFLVLLLVWIVWSLVIPKGSVIVASQFVKVPSANELNTRIQQVAVEGNQKTIIELDRYRKMHPRPERPYADPTGAAQAEYKRAFEKWDRQYSALFDELGERTYAEFTSRAAQIVRDYERRQQNRNVLAINLSRLSPASMITFASVDFAGTGISQLNHFMENVRTYQEALMNYVKIKNQDASSSNSDPVDLRNMPVFHPQQNALSDDMKLILPDFVLMTLFTVFFFACAYVLFLKYDVR